MNCRVFSSEADLHEGIGEAIDRATASSLSPYVGIVGALPEWLRDQLTRMTQRPHLAGDPDSVRQRIELDEELLLAEARDLDEPLDLVIIVGLPPASEPPWMNDARMILVVVGTRDEMKSWVSSALGTTWFFVVEDHWRAVVEPVGQKESV